MANTYTLIASAVLASNQTSITFSSIPSTYTDLVLRYSARSNNAATTAQFEVRINNDTNTIYSYTELQGNGATASSNRTSANNGDEVTSGLTGNTATASTFASGELYIPNYAGSQYKVSSIDSAHENNITTAYRKAHAGLYSGTTAISSLVINYNTTAVTGSSFYLYGIKNA